MRTWTRRDLTIISGIGGQDLVIACDSCGGVGEKPGDILKVPPYYAARLTARVCLTEVMCAGGTPKVLTDCLSCEMHPTGEEIVRGIQDELEEAGLLDVVVTGSTEENFTTFMTALGMTAIGFVKGDALKFNRGEKGDKVVLVGTPKVGSDVDIHTGGFYEEIRYLLSLKDVREIVPVGSKGIAYEAKNLAKLNGMRFIPFETKMDLHQSGGPATCMIVLAEEKIIANIRDKIPDTVIIGEIN